MSNCFRSELRESVRNGETIIHISITERVTTLSQQGRDSDQGTQRCLQGNEQGRRQCVERSEEENSEREDENFAGKRQRRSSEIKVWIYSRIVFERQLRWFYYADSVCKCRFALVRTN